MTLIQNESSVRSLDAHHAVVSLVYRPNDQGISFPIANSMQHFGTYKTSSSDEGMVLKVTTYFVENIGSRVVPTAAFPLDVRNCPIMSLSL